MGAMWRVTQRDQPDLFQPQGLLYIQCSSQVAVVDGVKGAAEYPDHGWSVGSPEAGGRPSGANVTIAKDDVFDRGQSLQSHRTAGMELVG